MWQRPEDELLDIAMNIGVVEDETCSPPPTKHAKPALPTSTPVVHQATMHG
jgi:hypothetical protein